MSSEKNKKPQQDQPSQSSPQDDNPAMENDSAVEQPAVEVEASGEFSPEELPGQQESLEDVKAQLQTSQDRYLRLMAEFDNYKKRTSRDFERLVESANERLMLELIEVEQNFDRALKAGDGIGDYQSFFDGMKMIYSKFSEILEKNGLEAFAEVGEVFDPQIHDALMNAPSDTVPEDSITEVFEKGYRLKNRVIKHARVIVSSGKPA